MKISANPRNRQGGAVAVIVGISLVLLVGFLALVIDLGHLYIVKTELQNGADAAALAGAKALNKELKITKASVDSAVAMAQDLAGKNYYDFHNYKILDTADTNPQNDAIDIWVGRSPKDIDMVPVASITDDAAAAGKIFLKVHTRNRDMVAWFAPIWNIFHVSTYGMAVAGRFKAPITPLAVCAIQIPDCPPSSVSGTGAGTGNCGYIQGMNYNVRSLNPLGPGTPYWLDPVATDPSECDGSAKNTVPFICSGDISIPLVLGSTVYTNTGYTNPQVDALNARFDLYPNSAKCDPATAPPDKNQQEYRADDNSLFRSGSPPNQATCTDTTNGCNWLVPAPFGTGAKPPAQQAAHNCSGTPGNVKCDYTNAVAWANNRPPATPANFFDPAYIPPQGSASAWPPSNIKTPATPPLGTYQQVYPASGTPSSATGNARYYSPVTDHSAVEGRRSLNMAIIQCTASGGICQPATVVGIASYYMTTQAGRKIGDDSQPTIYLEYNRMLTAGEVIGNEIKLFR